MLGECNHKLDQESLGMILKQKQTRFFGSKVPEMEGAIPRNKLDNGNGKVVAFLTRKACAQNMNMHFICPCSKQNEAVKFLILDLFSAAQRFLINFNSFFEVIAVFFKKFVGVTLKPDQGLVYYSWSKQKA